jgi:hypothetical protein
MTLQPNQSQPIDHQPIETDDVMVVIREAAAALAQADGLRFVDDTGKKNAHHAALSRELLLAADRLDLAASLVRVQYWRTRGVADPLKED